MTRRSTASSRSRSSFFASPRALALGGVLLLALVAPAAPAQENPEVHGAQLPPQATRIAEDRYVVDLTFEQTVRFYAKLYTPWRFPRHDIVNMPGVKALHISNRTPSKRLPFDGINVYQRPDGEVRIYVLKWEPPST